MWSRRQEFQLSVKLGLRKGLALIRGMRRMLNDHEQDKVAEAIVEQLERSNWKVEQGPTARRTRAENHECIRCKKSVKKPVE